MDIETNVREAFWADRLWLSEIDKICFKNPFEDSEWLYWFQNGKVTFIVERMLNGVSVPIGFAACIILEDGVFIEKIGVKPAFRREGYATRLLARVNDKALEKSWPHVVTLTVPEIYMSPGKVDDISGWVKKSHFKVRPPLQPGFFTIDGESVVGYPCIQELT